MEFLHIIINNIVPLIIFVAVGYLMDIKFNLQVTALTKLTFYVILPSFIFYSIYNAKINIMLLNVYFIAIGQMIIVGILATVVGKLRKFDSSRIEAIKNGTMFSNTGNIGAALITLVFSNAPFIVNGKAIYLPEAFAASTMILIQMNMFLNTLGLYQAGKGRLTPQDAIKVIFHIPVIYTLAAVFAVKWLDIDMTRTFMWPVFQYSAAALVAVVMTALGVQIHRSVISFKHFDSWIACFLRLIMGPVTGFILIKFANVFGINFSPITCQAILIMSCAPAPVNSVLYAIEFKNCVNFATEIVTMSTFLSVITMPAVIYAARILFPIS